MFVFIQRCVLLMLCCLLSFRSLAQHVPSSPLPVCGTPDLTEAQRQSLNKMAAQALVMKRTSGVAQTGITYVPIRPHIFRRSNGTGGMTLARLNNIVAITNGYYLLNGSGIQFYFCGTSPDYIDNDNLYNSFPVNNESVVNGRDAMNAINQYYVNAFSQSGLGGYSYFPGNTIQETRSFILNEDDELDIGYRLLPHELGHTFNLYHTFGNTSGGTTELVTRESGANCSTAGDGLCDTPADPYGRSNAGAVYVNGCQEYKGTATDAQGSLYSPSVTNLMSYYFPCFHDFTPGQYDRIQGGLALRQTHTAYSLDCPATAVAAPGNLNAVLTNSTVVLSWQDNATNEMGYFIERATSSMGPFTAIGGVGPNTTQFSDTRTTMAATYYYRIRPSNATTQGLSAVVNINIATCRPAYTPYACSAGDGLDGLKINGVTLSQQSGCSTGGYSASDVTALTVTAGQSVTFSATLIASTYRQGVSIWADLNHNGLFETSQNEQLYKTSGLLTGSFSGSLALPANLASGPLALRVVVAFNVVPGDACGVYSYGETEDYQLMVTNPQPVASGADLSALMQVSTRTPAVGQPVNFSLTLQNEGPLDATGVSWQSRLPPGLLFTGGDATVTNSGTAVGGSGLSISSGSAATFVYQLQPTQPGTYVNSVQILTSNQPDPDSQPGSGTGDGQDDAALVDLRTPSDNGPLFSSPNPNQTPLPAVVSNQPPPDPAKADLSLAMAVSTRTPAAGKPLTFSITVNNAGGLSGTGVVVRDTLWSLTPDLSSTTGINIVGSGPGYTIIEGTFSSVAAGSSAQLVFRAIASGSGYLRNVAQIWSASTADPDSSPGSATPNGNNLNGEDDVAWIDLRVGM